jgi:hypothetical protein
VNKAKIGRLIFFGLLALLMLAELFFSNVGSLGRLEAVAAQLGLTSEAERTRLFILIILDAIGGRHYWKPLVSENRFASNHFWFYRLRVLSNYFCTNSTRSAVAYADYDCWNNLYPYWNSSLVGRARDAQTE